MCNGLEGLFLALVEIDPCEMAKGTITECILDHPFNGSTIRLLPEQLSNIIVQHIGGIEGEKAEQALTHIHIEV